MKRIYYFVSVMIIFIQISYAQNGANQPYYHHIWRGNTNQPLSPESVGNSGTGGNINVVYHRVNWTINPNDGTKTITGTVTTYFTTLVANVSTLSFDLNKASFNNGSLSVIYHGTTCVKSFPSSGNTNILNITLPSAIITSNTLDSVVINYSGIPPGVNGAAEGYQAGSDAGAGNYIMTLSESYEDRDWWPCKADMQDKVDSMDIIVNVPWIPATGDTFWVATNGKLMDSAINGTTRTFTFKTRYPIASYLVCVSVAGFNRYYRPPININGTLVPVVYNLFKGKTAATYNTIIGAMDKMSLVLAAFSGKFGDYPFKLEKHGYYDGLLGAGGMEHQTFSAIATGNTLSDLKTLAHELMHQWFGDNVTFATWNDLWLAEGFARYSEALCGELVPSLGVDPYTTRKGYQTSALGLAGSAWIPNSSIVSSNTIWGNPYGSTVYDRGCMIVSMLRALAGDAKFYQALTNYQTNLAGKSATTDTLRNYFNAVLGVDISSFFNDYVGGSGNGVTPVGGVGNPIYTINWNNPTGKKLSVQVGSQGKTGGSNVAYFHGPVVLHVTGATPATMDTTIVFYDWGGGNLSFAGNGVSAPVPGNLLNYTLSFVPTTVKYDDSARTLSTGSTVKVGTLDVRVLDFSGRKLDAENELSLDVLSTDPISKVELQKSINGIDFNIVGEMSLTNNNNQVLKYKYNDHHLFAGNTFYRARIYYSAKDELTSIVKIQSSLIKKITVSPNPAKGSITVNFSNPANEVTVIKIISGEGKVVRELTTISDFIRFDLSNLSSGSYHVQLLQNDQVSGISKLIIGN